MSVVEFALIALLTPAAAAALLAGLPFLRNLASAAAALSIAAVTVSLTASAALLAAVVGGASGELIIPWMPGLPGAAPFAEIGIRVDGTSATMMLVVALVAWCVQVFSWKYLEGEPEKAFGRYYAYQSLFVFSMGTLVLAPNLLQLFAGWELVGTTSYLLIGHYFRKPSAAKAAVKAFWVNKIADVGLLFALIILYTQTGSFRWDVAVGGSVATAITLLLVLSVAGKSAQFPMHVWLPDAMEGPTPVSALLHAATMVAAGVYLVVRSFPLFEQTAVTGTVLAYLGAFTAIFAALLAVVQTDIKKMLAYSTVSQLGYMVAALGAGSVIGGYFHLLTHAGFKALLFLAAGNIIHAVHSNEMSKMGGLAKPMKVTATVFIIGALALAGVPGLSGAFSKDLVLEAVAAKGLWLPFAMLLAAVPLTAFYMFRAVFKAFFGPATHEAEHAHEAPLGMLVPVLALAVPAVGAGYLGAQLAGLVGAEYHFHVGGITVAATALALSGIALAYATTRGAAFASSVAGAFRGVESLARGAYVDKAWELGYRGAFLRVAAAAAWFDRYIVDALINALGAGALESGRRLRPVQTGNVRDYLLAVSSAVLVLVIWGVMR